MHARPLVAAAAGTAALFILTTAHGGPSIAAVDQAPALTESELADVDEEGLEIPGARSSSTTTFEATGASLTDRITNLPPLLRAPQAQPATGAQPAAGAQSASAAQSAAGGQAQNASASAPKPSAAYGSVSQTTEDGITIAGLTDRIDMPDDGLGIIGLVYDEHSDVRFEVRTQQDGEWSDWSELQSDASDEGRPGTDPYYVAGAQSAQVRILGDGWEPEGTRVLLVDPERRDADAEAVRDNVPVAPQEPAEAPESGPAEAPESGPAEDPGLLDESTATEARSMTYVPGGATTAQNVASTVEKTDRPTIRSRDDWGADESIGSTDPAIEDEATAAIVHHTAGANDYDAEDVPAILRGIHTFHVEGQGWDDVGYNMFADKYGRLWEGRAGGLSKAVVGAHAVGYNTGTFGISVLGTFESKAPPQKALDAVSGAIAWKLSLSGTSADAKTTIAGERMRTVIGHRDVGATTCPGDAFYAQLGDVRSTAVAMQEGERSVDPKSEKDSKSTKDDKDGDKKSESKDGKKSKDKKSKDEKDGKKSGGKGSDDGLGAGVEQLSPGVAED